MEDSKGFCPTSRPKEKTYYRLISKIKNFYPRSALRKKIYLWDKNQKLKWDFATNTRQDFKNAFNDLINKAIIQWEMGSDPIPIQLIPVSDSNIKDKEINFIVEKSNVDLPPDLNNGFTYAKAFFPEENIKKLIIYPAFFNYLNNQYDIQVNIIAHELGHIFGLCHPYDNGCDAWSDNVYNTVMIVKNPVQESDRRQLQAIYKAAWNKELVHGRTVVLLKPTYG